MNFRVYFLTKRSDYTCWSSYQMFYHWYSNITEAGWQFWKPSSPAHCSKQGQLEQVILYRSSQFQISAWMENCTASIGNLCQFRNNLTGKRKLLYLIGISCVSVCPHCLLSCQWTTRKRAWIHSFHTFLSSFIYIEIPTDLLFPRLGIPTYLNLSS